jgi:sirohydrochlorin cobaltochelatase
MTAAATPQTSAGRGIILLAHGSRDPQWREPIEAVAAQIRADAPGTPVLCAYVELCAPSLPEAAMDLIAEGVDSIRVFPLFFGVGKHAREDLPRLVDEIRASHPRIEVTLLPTAGEYRELTALMAAIALA